MLYLRRPAWRGGYYIDRRGRSNGHGQARCSLRSTHKRSRTCCSRIFVGASGMAKVKAAIIGSGNIGTDLMITMIKYPQNMELAAVVGIDAASEGLAMARDTGLTPPKQGVAGLRALPHDAQIGFGFWLEEWRVGKRV